MAKRTQAKKTHRHAEANRGAREKAPNAPERQRVREAAKLVIERRRKVLERLAKL